TLTPSPPLPRKRGRERIEFAARADSTPYESHPFFQAWCAIVIACSVHSLPPVRGGGREGAWNKIERACKKIHMRTLTPSPASGGGSRPSSPLALIPLHTNIGTICICITARPSARARQRRRRRGVGA